MINPIKCILATLDSMFVVFKHLFKPAVTLEYPEKKRELNGAFRGKLEVKGCTGCGICKRVCPSGAISFQKDENGKICNYVFDLNKCIFCGNCKFYCPCGAVKMTTEYELATEDKTDLKLNYKGGDYDD